ncbi:hypothetical protein ACFOGG_00360 [Brenneria rubrifaciens]|uniref:hypothetical protein n=1 Tax=Brenneria rubrifaciens TaxID=55213 RepID=UPI00362208E2
MPNSRQTCAYRGPRDKSHPSDSERVFHLQADIVANIAIEPVDAALQNIASFPPHFTNFRNTLCSLASCIHGGLSRCSRRQDLTNARTGRDNPPSSEPPLFVSDAF